MNRIIVEGNSSGAGGPNHTAIQGRQSVAQATPGHRGSQRRRYKRCGSRAKGPTAPARRSRRRGAFGGCAVTIDLGTDKRVPKVRLFKLLAVEARQIITCIAFLFSLESRELKNQKMNMQMINNLNFEPHKSIQSKPLVDYLSPQWGGGHLNPLKSFQACERAPRRRAAKLCIPYHLTFLQQLLTYPGSCQVILGQTSVSS